MVGSVWLKRGLMLILLMIVFNLSIAQHVGPRLLARNTVAWEKRNIKTTHPSPEIRINIWHGLSQKIGHIGHSQNDFNILGNLEGFESIVSFRYSLNSAEPVNLNIARGMFGDDRRLAAPGDFNADVPIFQLREGKNNILLTAVDSQGREISVTVQVERLRGNNPLPISIDWDKIDNPQDVGQYVDGKWGLENGGLRTLRTGYDRVFLIGDTTWQDYEVTVPVTIHRVDPQTGPVSGGNGIGILARFTGHVIVGPRNFPPGQPKWGYQPFGAIGFLRWKDGQNSDPTKQFYRGDNNQTQNFGTISLTPGNIYWMKMRCRTLPDHGQDGFTRYSFKIWDGEKGEPAQWDWEVDQTSRHALRKGGVVLLAHHVDATFGDVKVIPLRVP